MSWSDNRRCLTRLIAGLLCALSLGLGVPAQAATIVGDVGELSAAAVDVGRTGSLTITLTPGNPFDEVPPGARPRGGLAGTEFTAHRVAGIALDTDAGWVQAADLSLAEARLADHDLTVTATTDARGVAHFPALPVGVYLVTATVPESATHTYRRPQDMVLTVPLGQQGTWRYDVLINAKYEPDTPPVIPPILPPVGPPGTPPVVPGTPTTRTVPPAEETTPPAHPDHPERTTTRLPVTGAGVLGSGLLGCLLLILGAGLIRAHRRNNEKA